MGEDAARRLRPGRTGCIEYLPPRCPPKADTLETAFAEAIARAGTTPDTQQAGIRLHLDFARTQFFWDGNKRTGLPMANGLLLANDLPPLSIPAKRLHDYNAGMIRFYESGDPGEMLAFLRECHCGMSERFGE